MESIILENFSSMVQGYTSRGVSLASWKNTIDGLELKEGGGGVLDGCGLSSSDCDEEDMASPTTSGLWGPVAAEEDAEIEEGEIVDDHVSLCDEASNLCGVKRKLGGVDEE